MGHRLKTVVSVVASVALGGLCANAPVASAAGSGPTVTTAAASAVSGPGATLNGTVNTNGVAASCYFAYGTSTTYTTSSAPVSEPAGSSAVAVTTAVIGLTPGTTYHYNLICSSTGSKTTAQGTDKTFMTSAATTATKPTAVTAAAALQTNQSAALTGSVNPNGSATGCYYEYGKTTTYGTDTPAVTAGSGTSAAAAIQGVSALSPSTTYHYQLVCTNAGGATLGGDKTFATTNSPYAAAVAVTGAATSVTSSSATLNGTVAPLGTTASCLYEYGPSATYGLAGSYGAHTALAAYGAGNTAVAATQSITGLTAGTTYHYQLYCVNSAGVVAGGDKTFTTSPAGTTPTTAKAKVAFSGPKSLTVNAKGQVTFKLKCTKAKCAGTLTLTTTTKAAKTTREPAKKKAKTFKVGSHAFNIKAGKTGSVTIKLGKAYLAYLKHHKLSVAATAADKDKTKATGKFTLRYKAAKKK